MTLNQLPFSLLLLLSCTLAVAAVKVPFDYDADYVKKCGCSPYYSAPICGRFPGENDLHTILNRCFARCQ